MLNFIICEDDDAVNNCVRHYIEEYISQNDLPGEVTAYKSHFEQILNSINPASHKTNVYFLDIFLGDHTNGLVLARKIREKDVNGYIIFITGHLEFSFKVFQYKLKALDYIFKGDGDIRKRVFDCLDTIKKELNRNAVNAPKEPVFEVQSDSGHYFIPFNDIIYFETETLRRRIILHTIDNSIEFRGTLDNLKTKLDSCFYRCHRSFIVNVNHIKMISTKRNNMHIQLSNNAHCILSPKYFKNLVELVRNLV